MFGLLGWVTEQANEVAAAVSETIRNTIEVVGILVDYVF